MAEDKIDDTLTKHWEKRGDHIVFTGSEPEFNEWIELWLDTVPKCRDFACCHELMSCGIMVACSCSIYPTMAHAHGNVCYICGDVYCVDCMNRHDCRFGLLTLEELETVPKLWYDKVSDRGGVE